MRQNRSSKQVGDLFLLYRNYLFDDAVEVGQRSCMMLLKEQHKIMSLAYPERWLKGISSIFILLFTYKTDLHIEKKSDFR